MGLAEEHREFVDRAGRIFLGSKSIHDECYETARDRMLNWIKALKPFMGAIDRWRLGCEGAWDAVQNLEPPYPEWAQRLLDTELAEILAKFHEHKLATEFPSTNPAEWPPYLEPLTIKKDLNFSKGRIK